jgi:hypothetical protein
MTKNTKTAITIGAVAIVGYFIWNRIVASTHKGFVANASGRKVAGPIADCRKACKNSDNYIRCMADCLQHSTTSGEPTTPGEPKNPPFFPKF